ncbi:MAG: benzoate/H(+) symporter BenE family transporter [Pseudomonadota bacterium]
MFKEFSLSATTMGLLAAFVGTASSFAVVLAGLRAMGASEAEAASGLMAIAVAKGVTAVFLCAWTRVPISLAWSTPGAALLATSGALPGGFAEATGAFLICGLLLAATGIIAPLRRGIEMIPPALSSALLAGVLLTFCLAPFEAIAFNPAWGLPIFLAWVVGGRINRLLAAPSALIAFVGVVIFGVQPSADDLPGLADITLTMPIFTAPEFTIGGLIGVALPLYLVTMAGQNLPGAGILQSLNYPPHIARTLGLSGLASAIAAPFGGHACNYAAITAAMCASEEAHPDPARRYWAALASGVFYVIFGLFAGVAVAFVLLAPQILITAVGGLALFGAFTGAAVKAFENAEDREPAAVTFLFTASGVAFFGVSGAFWGLIAGGIVYALKRRP